MTAKPTESLRSLSYRACAINDLPNSWGLLRHMGLLHRNQVLVAESPDIETAQLAHAMRVADQDVLLRRYEDLGRDHRSFFGLGVHEQALETRIRSFSPAAFRADAAKRSGPSDRAYAFHRATWELRAIPFCLEHWDMLQNRCWCETDGVIQHWTRTASHLHECDRCGDPLADLESFPVPPDMHPALDVLRAFVDPIASTRAAAAEALRAAVREADRSRMFKAVVRLADAIDPDAKDRPINEPRERLHGLWRACTAVIDWPEGFGEIAEFAVTPAQRSKIRAAWLAISDAASSGDRKKAQYQAAFHPGKAANGALSRRDALKLANSLKPVGIRPATEIARLSTEVLMWAWEQGHFTQHRRAHGPRELPAFDRGELVTFSDMWTKRVTASSLAHELGITLHGVEQLAALDVIPASAPAIRNSGPHFYPEDVENFFMRFEEVVAKSASAAETIADPVTLIHAMKHVSGRPKPWGPVIKMLLDGDMCFEVSANRRVADCIVISARDIDVLKGLQFDRDSFEITFSPEIIQNDALSLLNVAGSAVRVLDGLSSRGVNPKFYRVADVEARAQKFVTLPELALALNMIPADAYYWLEDERLTEAMPGLWNRDVIETIVAHRPDPSCRKA
ncbi:hypothetical protein QE363_001764 [Sphingomonas sp. SORGH_AS870]|uniref:hypothetical protein n=1 Tax=Sphingomonas sp. SORGH_AS_0870 TaxID=3041801 RepID=UPI00285AF8E9|nr:hypothetical protein [Sphingomonas sp. SORGH_AS_0870]MDR6145971.1 hypothetical protein [Sphingomonas sp. SORGH_AS_0870]